MALVVGGIILVSTQWRNDRLSLPFLRETLIIVIYAASYEMKWFGRSFSCGPQNQFLGSTAIVIVERLDVLLVLALCFLCRGFEILSLQNFHSQLMIRRSNTIHPTKRARKNVTLREEFVTRLHKLLLLRNESKSFASYRATGCNVFERFQVRKFKWIPF